MQPTDQTQQKFDGEVLQLVKLWALADMLLLARLQNAVIDRLQEMWRLPSRFHRNSTSWIRCAIELTIVSSPIRMFVLRHLQFEVDYNIFLRYPEHFPAVVLFQLAVKHRYLTELLEDKRDHPFMVGLKPLVERWMSFPDRLKVAED